MLKRFLRTVVSDAAGEYLTDFTSRGTVVQRAYAAHTAAMVIPESHPVVATMLGADGARGAVWMVSVDEDAGTLTSELVCSGRVLSLSGEDAPYGTVGVNVVDDKSLLDSILGWQVPGAPLAGQSAAEYATYTGPTETRVKAAVAANVARLGLAWDVVPTRGKGTTGTLELRMHDLTRKVMPLLEADRLILSVIREDTGRWTVDVVEGATFPRPLTPMSGVLQSWSWVIEQPTATRVVIGGRGEGTEREFQQVTDTARETALGLPLEVFIDARNTEEGSDITPSGWDELADRSGKAGFTADLLESSWFSFPDGYRLGDRVNIEVGALSVDDVITQVVISDDPENGFRVKPTVGLATADPQEQLLALVKKISTQVRGLERR
ncbi:hypothetical protein DC31_13945 [Microbacterium sp. CH12i]|uniref:Gp37-like protein n=1 Tax=Microbacterium sp. CH12i TaxID=1479651 RepID=UPI000460F750|nr:hypothetical protein [Microbacterium sp. CH12i]KDA05566.1 hypothetical protein DC31_13945 [Microbacterium sp. CH12i]